MYGGTIMITKTTTTPRKLIFGMLIKNRRNMETTSIFLKMEYNIDLFLIELNLNLLVKGRRH
jgi:hypothetical protein